MEKTRMTEIHSQDTLHFIRTHRREDVRLLALQAHRYPSVDMPAPPSHKFPAGRLPERRYLHGPKTRRYSIRFTFLWSNAPPR